MNSASASDYPRLEYQIQQTKTSLGSAPIAALCKFVVDQTVIGGVCPYFVIFAKTMMNRIVVNIADLMYQLPFTRNQHPFESLLEEAPRPPLLFIDRLGVRPKKVLHLQFQKFIESAMASSHRFDSLD